MALPTIRVTREEMAKRVARFKELKGFDGGLPDSNHPDAKRTLYNVIGFQPPKYDEATTSPVGSQAAEASAIKISEGFNLGYCEAEPGKGPMMHNHDTNETFIPMTGTWRALNNVARAAALTRSPLPSSSLSWSSKRRKARCPSYGDTSSCA